MKRIWGILEDKLNDYSVKKKLTLFYMVCVLLPLFITDSVIMRILYRSEIAEKKHELENVASAIESELIYTFEESAKMANTVYLNRAVNEFLDQRYDSNLDYYNACLEVEKKTFYEVSGGASSTTKVVMYSDNDTIVNGDYFYRLESAEKEEWYQNFKNADEDMILQFYYIGKDNPSAKILRRVSIVRKLDYYKDLKTEKIVRLDLDYSSMVRKLINMQYKVPVYVCSGDKIICSTVGDSSTRTDFSHLTGAEEISYSREFDIYGENIRILILETDSNLLNILEQHLPLILLMLSINIFLPVMMAIVFNRSIVSRLTELSNAFDEVEAESLKEIENARGKDEIGSLMRNYNRMVYKSRELIKTVYKDQIEKQKMDIARQNAELLALHSQINPHFLFNVLEGIRMQSILKGEDKTAAMIERLAVLERQNVNWKNDMITIKEEIKFIEAYLELQKLRFGERLHYQVDVENSCFGYHIPKLTLVTFVENACVHGMENKSAACWIYVRVYEKNGILYFEIEDTGAGIEEEKAMDIRKKMMASDIEALRQYTHIGIANACLRLRMVTKQQAEFELDTELGIGTLIMVKVPVESLSKR